MYKELIMFDTGDPVIQMAHSEEYNVLYTLTEKTNKKRFISVLSVPEKMIETSSGLARDRNDMKIKTGIFTSCNPTKIISIFGTNRLVSSQCDVKGIVLYNFTPSGPDSSEKIAVEKVCDFPLVNPDIALPQRDIVVMAKDSDQPAYVGDLTTESVSNVLTIESGVNDRVTPMCLGLESFALTLKSTGEVHMFDRRMDGNYDVGIIPGERNPQLGSSWKAFSEYEFVDAPYRAYEVLLLSNTGYFKHHDLRNLNDVIRTQLPLPATENDRFKICFRPESSETISISGFDDCVYLYDTTDMTQLFKHDGHTRSEHCSKDTYVTDHFWYNYDYVVSCALNNTINCWFPDQHHFTY